MRARVAARLISVPLDVTATATARHDDAAMRNVASR